MKQFSFASKVALGIVLLLMLLASDLLAGGVIIAPARSSFQLNEPLSATFTCGCPFPCGDAAGMDDIYLHRQRWTQAQMGLWYPLGSLRNGGPAPTTVTRSFPIPASIEPASDYVITVWSGEENCSGHSPTFAIGQANSQTPELRASLQPLTPIHVLQPGGSPSVPTGMGMPVPIAWEPSGANRLVVDIDLIGPGGETYPIAARVANNGRYNGWRVNYHQQAGQLRLNRPLSFGANFKIRVRQSDHHDIYGESAPFRIPRPEITISCPRVIRDGRADDRFYRGDRMEITWTSRYIDPMVMAELRTSCRSPRPGSGTFENAVTRLPATINHFNWTVAINAHPNYDPFECGLHLILDGTDIEFTSDNRFTVTHH